MLIVVALVFYQSVFATGMGGDGGISNPLGTTRTISDVLINFTKWLLGIAGVIALLALIVGGVRMILAFGREDMVASSKKIIYWAIIGLVVIVASYAIINIVVNDILK